MKVDEIAESLESASGTVKNHLFQARKTLDKKLKMFKESRRFYYFLGLQRKSKILL